MPCLPRFASASNSQEPFRWSTDNLVFSFEVKDGKLRQKRLLPAGAAAPDGNTSSGVEVALQCSGEDSPDQGMKSGLGQPGARLLFIGKREESTPGGNRLVLTHTDPILHLRVESVYEAFDGVPVVRSIAAIQCSRECYSSESKDARQRTAHDHLLRAHRHIAGLE